VKFVNNNCDSLVRYYYLS